MTYWIYDPKRLTSSSTLIPYKIQDIGDLLNFMTLSLFIFYVYIYKNNLIEKHGKNLLSVLLTVMVLGLLTGLQQDKNDNVLHYDFKNYDRSLYID